MIIKVCMQFISVFAAEDAPKRPPTSGESGESTEEDPFRKEESSMTIQKVGFIHRKFAIG